MMERTSESTAAFPYRLRSCVWEITLACCFNCRHCGSRAGAARPDELTTEECLDVVRQLKELGCRRVSLIGGEVFMRSDWAEIAGALTSSGIRVCIITNGFIFSNALIETLKDIGIESVAVSLDGTRALHDRFRQHGSYDRAIAAIDRLTAEGVPVSVITTLNSENVECLEDMYEALKTKDIFAWQIQACSPMGNAASHDQNRRPANSSASDTAASGYSVSAPVVPDQAAPGSVVSIGFDHRFDFRKAIRFVEGRAGAPFAIGIADNIGYFTDYEGSLRGRRDGRSFFRGCKAGLEGLGIDSIGNVRGCESMYDEAFNEGNLRERTLREIWEDPDSFTYNRKFTPDLLTGACADCEYGSRCAAGCRSYNFFTGGKLYESQHCARKAHLSDGPLSVISGSGNL